MPSALQERVHAEVTQTKARSGWPVERTLAALGVSRSSYYRWLRASKEKAERAEPLRPVQAYEATATEKEAVLAYARKHPALRHRELAWRMVDEDVAYVSASTVYRILRGANLVCPWRRRTKRRRTEDEKPTRPNQRWGTDLMYLQVAGTMYYWIGFLDEYSRYLVHQELLTGMDADAVSLAAEAAVAPLPRDAAGRVIDPPEMRTDNGSAYVSKEFRSVLREHGLSHHRIRPHCPEENGLVERANRTMREAWEDAGAASANVLEAREEMNRIARWYNEERLHSALGYLRPADYHRGNPAQLHEARRHKLRAARQRRKETNLKLGQRRLVFAGSEGVA